MESLHLIFPADHGGSPTWSTPELLDLISIWSKSPMQSQLHCSQRNFDTSDQISHAMAEKGYERNMLQYRAKIKEVRQSYQKAREVNHCSEAEPMRCHIYKDLEEILSGDPTFISKMLPSSKALGPPDTGLNPDKEIINEEVELEDDPDLGSFFIAVVGSQELFPTPKCYSHPQPLSSGALDTGDGSSDVTFTAKAPTPANCFWLMRK